MTWFCKKTNKQSLTRATLTRCGKQCKDCKEKEEMYESEREHNKRVAEEFWKCWVKKN